MELRAGQLASSPGRGLQAQADAVLAQMRRLGATVTGSEPCRVTVPVKETK